MLEIKRQFVLFGNFNSITFDNIMNLSELREEYNFKLNAMPDIFAMPIGQPINLSINAPESRPIFQTPDKKTTVFFGTERIHVEQLDCSSDTYGEFNKMSLTTVIALLKNLELIVNRVAINGELFSDDEAWGIKAFNSVFNKSKLYSDKSNEWNFRICDKEKIDTLGCEVNKIAQYSRGRFLDNNRQERDGLIIGYDFNTQVNADKIFTESDIICFNELAQEYRKLFL